MAEPLDELPRWLSEARAGSLEALGKALETCRSYLLLVADRELDPALRAKGGASDLVQATMMDALRDFDRFRGGGREELLSWLRQLLRNNVVDFVRLYRDTGKREVGREVGLHAGSSAEALGLEPRADTPSPSRVAVSREEAEAFARALLQLPDDYQRVLELRYQDEMSFEEIGHLFNLTPNAARKLWLRAVRRLQQLTNEPP